MRGSKTVGDLQTRVAHGLAAVEAHLKQIITSDEPFITEAAAHLLNETESVERRSSIRHSPREGLDHTDH